MTYIGQTMLSATLPPLATRPLRDGRRAGDCVEDLSEGKAFSFWFNFSSGLSSQRNSGVSLSPLFSDSAASVCVFFFFRWLPPVAGPVAAVVSWFRWFSLRHTAVARCDVRRGTVRRHVRVFGVRTPWRSGCRCHIHSLDWTKHQPFVTPGAEGYIIYLLYSSIFYVFLFSLQVSLHLA